MWKKVPVTNLLNDLYVYAFIIWVSGEKASGAQIVSDDDNLTCSSDGQFLNAELAMNDTESAR